MKTSLRGFGLFFLLLLISGCATMGKLPPFTDSADEILVNATRIHLIKDCLILEHTSGQKALYSQERNKTICTNYLQSIEERLANLGLDSVEVRSINGGLQAGPNRYALAYDSEQELVHFPVPFSSHRLGPEERYVYATIAEDLYTIVRGYKFRYDFIESLRSNEYHQLRFLDIPEDELVMMVLTGGLHFPGHISATQTVVTALLSLGTMMAYNHGFTFIRIVVLDHQGRPVWADVAYSDYVRASGESVDRLLSQLLRYFPEINQQTESRQNQ